MAQSTESNNTFSVVIEKERSDTNAKARAHLPALRTSAAQLLDCRKARRQLQEGKALPPNPFHRNW
jgi:hypothetical protein